MGLRVFIASSSERLDVAHRVAGLLESPEIDPHPWDKGTFTFSKAYIEALEDELDRADFAVVVMIADDLADVRNKTVALPRDNVIFELGLFVGRLGRARTFFLIDGSSDTQIASDLSGVNPVKFYEDLPGMPKRGASLGEQLGELRGQMLTQGPRYKPSVDARKGQDALWRISNRIAGHWWERMRVGEDDKSAISYVEITVDPVTNCPCLNGWAYDQAGAFLAEWHTVVAGVTTVKSRVRLSYRWEGEHEKEHDQTYGGGGHITFDDDSLSSGAGYYYDTNFASIAAGAHTRVKHFGLYRCDPADELIMSKPQSSAAKKLASERAAALDGR